MSAITAGTQPKDAITKQLKQRQMLDQFGRLGLILILLAALAAFLVTPFLVSRWLAYPFAGSLLEFPLTANLAASQPFVDVGSLDEPGSMLRQNDSIVAVNGVAVTSSTEYYREISQFNVGETITLGVINDDGTARSLSIVLDNAPAGTLLPLYALTYIAGLIYLGVGYWVYRNRRDHVIGRFFFTFCASIAIVMVGYLDLMSTHLFVQVWTGMMPLSASLLLAFALVFPTELPRVATRPIWRWAPLIPGIILIAVVQVGMATAPHAIVTQLWRLQYVYASLYGLIFVLIMLGRSVFANSPAAREQSRVVFAGSVLAFLPFLLWSLGLADIQIGWVFAALILFPLTIAYSIVQYNVLNTSRMASFATTYGIMGIITSVGYALVVAGITMISTAGLGSVAANPLLIGGLAFILVLAFQPLRTHVQNMVDQLFFKSISSYEERLTAFRHSLTMASNLADIVRLLKNQIRETLMPTHTYVYLRDAESGDFLAAAEGLRPDTDIRFEAQSGLVHALSTARDVLFLELNKPLPPELVEEHARLAILRTPVLAPLQGQERLAGWVAVGNKRSGERFSVDDLRFIQALTEQASLAVERAQVIGDLERRVRELDVLSQVSQAVNFTTDPDVLMELIYTQTSKLIDATNFYILLHNPNRQSMSYAFFVEGAERYEEREGEEWNAEVGLASEVVRTGRPIRTANYLSECRRRNVEPRPDRHVAWMGVPLNAGTRTLGVMVVGSFVQGVTFTDDQLKFFWAIADQAATALDKARLFRETETRARQLATLNQISTELSSTLDLQNLLVRIMRSAVEMLGTEAGSLFLIEESGDLVFRVVEGGAQDLVGTRIPAGKGIVGEAAETGAPVIVNNVMQDKRWFSDVDRETEFQTQSLLAVPLLMQDNVIGVLEVINKQDGSPFSDEEISLLTTFAAQAAIAIENARLYEATDAELAARVDELQNLVRIDRELNRTLRMTGVIQITLDWALRITGSGAGLIVMMEPDADGATILTGTGYDNEWYSRHTEEPLSLDEGIIGRVLRSGKPEFIPDVTSDPDHTDVTLKPTVSMIVVPILRVSKPIGALVLESHIPGLLTVDDFGFAQRLVEHAAVAIENARLIGEVEQANRDKTEFISFVAHELKNPMTSIRGYTDLLKGGGMGEVNDMQKQFLGTIRSNVDRMTRLVSDLSDVARIETGHMRLEISTIPVQPVIDETLRGLQGMIDDKKQTLHLDVDDAIPQIKADHTRMVQVLTNLISNGHKYTPEEGEIWVSAHEGTYTDSNQQSQRMVHIAVRDTGIGMSEEELNKLFTKFFRTSRAKDMAQGTGLGLIITRNLVESHGGTIWVESAVGEGTTFHFTVPVAAEEAAEQAAD